MQLLHAINCKQLLHSVYTHLCIACNFEDEKLKLRSKLRAWRTRGVKRLSIRPFVSKLRGRKNQSRFRSKIFRDEAIFSKGPTSGVMSRVGWLRMNGPFTENQRSESDRHNSMYSEFFWFWLLMDADRMYTFFFYKNTLYKNKLRTTPASKYVKIFRTMSLRTY